MTISTISMRQNCSISFSAAPGGRRIFVRAFGAPRNNYDVQRSLNNDMVAWMGIEGNQA